MTTTKKIPSGKSKKQSVLPQPTLYQLLNAVLHTMRCIVQYEDALCELAHHLKTHGKLTPNLGKELAGILEKIPGQDYLDDVAAVRNALESLTFKNAD